MKKVLARGHALGNSNSGSARMLGNDGDVKAFTLKSGKQAKFVKTVVLNGEIESEMFVDVPVSGCSQAMLSCESATDTSRTIRLQQFPPAIGREVNGRIEVLDGTRHQVACTYNNVKFEILITKDDIDLVGARQLAKDIQTAREHGLRELEKRLEVIYGTSMTKEEVALAENVSSAEVTRVFQVASVPDEMISVSPVIDDISLSDYRSLLKLSEKTNHRKTSAKKLMDKVWRKLMALPDYPATDKSRILSVFRVENKAPIESPAKTVEAEKLREFIDHNQFVRKKTDLKERPIVYEFSRISNGVQSETDEVIKHTLEKLPSSRG